MLIARVHVCVCVYICTQSHTCICIPPCWKLWVHTDMSDFKHWLLILVFSLSIPIVRRLASIIFHLLVFSVPHAVLICHCCGCCLHLHADTFLTPSGSDRLQTSSPHLSARASPLSRFCMDVCFTLFSSGSARPPSTQGSSSPRLNSDPSPFPWTPSSSFGTLCLVPHIHGTPLYLTWVLTVHVVLYPELPYHVHPPRPPRTLIPMRGQSLH